MIEFENVSVRYANGYQALNDVSFTVPDGALHFLTGHSGAGKTTLLRLIPRLLCCTRGSVRIAGEDLSAITDSKLPYFRRKIGVVFQEPHLIEERNTFENVAATLEVIGIPPREIKRRVRAALDKVGLGRKETVMPDTLSAGEKQRLALARAVVNKPDLVIADEPTGNLDPTLADEMFDLLREFNKVGVSLLIATHDITRIARLPYRILTLKDGQMSNQPTLNNEAVEAE